MTYLFYDIETTGLSKCFDQVLQFAAIRTDEKLCEIDRHEFRIRLNPDVIPSPQALLTTNITIEEAQQGECEFEAIEKIHRLMNESGTISIGYNSLGFDDEFLRFSFYRNLLPPYTHQYANQCGRMDLYPMTLMYYLYKPDVLEWPLIDGKPSMKLEHLCSANHLADGDAHDAMVDVVASLALARTLFNERKMWDYLCEYFDKNSDIARIARLTPAFEANHYYHRQALYVEGSLGPKNHYQCPVLSLGTHNHYKNQTLWLRLDTNELPQTTADNIPEHTWVIHKKTGEPGFLLPFIPRFSKHLDNERQAIMENNKHWLQSNPELLRAIKDYSQDYTYPLIPNLDINAALYQNGFPSPADEQQFHAFHQASLKDKIQMLDHFRDPGQREQAIRILARNYPDGLPEPYRNEFAEHMQSLHPSNEENALLDYRGKPRLTPTAALNEIDELLKSSKLNNKQIALLSDLKHYIEAQL